MQAMIAYYNGTAMFTLTMLASVLPRGHAFRPVRRG